MPVMKRQTAFNNFYQAFVIDGQEQCREDVSGMCVYLNPEGRGCAIGIQPEFKKIYDDSMEGNGIDALYQDAEVIRDIIAQDDLEFFTELQNLHDAYGGYGKYIDEPYEVSSKVFAAQWKVDIPPTQGVLSEKV